MVPSRALLSVALLTAVRPTSQPIRKVSYDAEYVYTYLTFIR